MGKIIEGIWTCDQCGKNVPGSKRNCPNCGNTRNNTTTFSLPATKKYIPVKETKKIKTSNFKSIHSHSENSKQTNSTKIKDIFGKISNFFTSYWKSILSTTLILSVIVGIVFLFIPKYEEITVTDFSWERSIAIEKYQTVDESDWQLPPNARLKYSREEIRIYKEVLDHYETSYWEVTEERKVGEKEVVVGYKDLGNGYFEEITKTEPIYETYTRVESSKVPIYIEEPVYDTKYYYEIDKWLYDRTSYNKGKGQINVKWPDVSNLSSDERISTKQEKYFVIGYNSKEESKKFELPYSSWIDLKSGQKITIKYTVFGKGEIIE